MHWPPIFFRTILNIANETISLLVWAKIQKFRVIDFFFTIFQKYKTKAIEDKNVYDSINKDIWLKNILEIFDKIFTLIFTLELLMK